MKKLSTLILPVLCMGIISCGDTKKEQEELETTLDKIEALEKEINQANKELDQKVEEVESALSELDNI